MVDVYRSGQGYIGTFEYEPIGADISLIATGLPQACLVSDPAIELGKPNADRDTPLACNAARNLRSHICRLPQTPNPSTCALLPTTPHAGFLILRLRSYHAWQVKVNGRTVDSLPFRKDGLIAVPVPQGAVNLSVDWTTTTDASWRDC